MAKSDKPTEILDHPLIRFSKDNPKDWWTIRDAVRGVQVFGGIGSGKSSGSGKTLAYAFLKKENGFGGLVLTGKVDETLTWLKYAAEMGRLDDVIVFGAERPLPPPDREDKFKEYRHLLNKEYRFNPLRYEMERPVDEGGGETDNIVALFVSIIKAGDRITGTGGGSSDDPFWDRALQRCIKAAVDLLKLAKKGVAGTGNEGAFDLTVANIAEVIRRTPIGQDNSGKFLTLVAGNGTEGLEDWVDENGTINNYTIRCLFEAELSAENDSQKRILEVVKSYFLTDLPTMPEKTRGSILEIFYAFSNPFRSGLLAD